MTFWELALIECTKGLLAGSPTKIRRKPGESIGEAVARNAAYMATLLEKRRNRR